MKLDHLTAEAMESFGAAYPLEPAHLTHRLAGHPLFEIDALASLAGRLNPAQMEYVSTEGLEFGMSEADAKPTGLSVQETIATIDRSGSWVLLRKVDHDPAYRQLMREVLGLLKAQIEPVTGPMYHPEAFIFISSPKAVTLPHFDPEYNILLQIRGRKTMTVFSSEDSEMVPPLFREQYYDGGRRYLPWKEEFDARGREIHIKPGEGIYVPIHAPHWVQTHDEVSVSLSLTWHTKWAYQHSDAQRFNHWIRKWGFNPSPPRLYPGSNLMKSVAHRALRRAKRLARRGA